jgi:hypothetical protein
MVWCLTKGINIARSVPNDTFKNCWEIRRLKEVRASDLKGKMLQKGDDESKRYPSLQKIRGKKRYHPVTPITENTHFIIVIRARFSAALISADGSLQSCIPAGSPRSRSNLSHVSVRGYILRIFSS